LSAAKKGQLAERLEAGDDVQIDPFEPRSDCHDQSPF
jgi:hypothetical protein